MEISTVALEPVSTHDERLVRVRRERHRFMLGLSVVVLVMAFVLQFRGSESLRLPGTKAALPAICGSRLLFGVECPGCGLTRSFVALAAGDFHQSFQYNRVGWILALTVVAQVPYRVYKLRQLRHGIIADRAWPVWFGYFLIAALILNWLLKMLSV